MPFGKLIISGAIKLKEGFFTNGGAMLLSGMNDLVGNGFVFFEGRSSDLHKQRESQRFCKGMLSLIRRHNIGYVDTEIIFPEADTHRQIFSVSLVYVLVKVAKSRSKDIPVPIFNSC